MWVPVSCERRALGLWLRVLGMKCSVPWLSCGEEGRVEVKRPWASELVCNFVHVPVSKEEPWLSLHSQECPRPEKGQSLHYPDPAAGTRGLGHLVCPKTQDHPRTAGEWSGGRCARLVHACKGEEWAPRSGWVSKQNGALPDPLPTLTTQAAESRLPSHPRPLGKMASPTIICEPHLQAQSFLPRWGCPLSELQFPHQPRAIYLLLLSPGCFIAS